MLIHSPSAHLAHLTKAAELAVTVDAAQTVSVTDLEGSRRNACFIKFTLLCSQIGLETCGE